MDRILVPLDGSAEAEAALPIARACARAHGARLFLARAATEGPTCSPAGVEAEAYLARVAASIDGVDVAHGVLLCPAADAILEVAASLPADLIIMGTRGGGAAAEPGGTAPRTGDVTAAVIRCATAPVLAVPAAATAGAPGPDPFDGILIPLDGSAAATAFLPRLEDMAGGEDRRRRATLLRVIGDGDGGGDEREVRGDLEAIATRLRSSGLETSVRVERGHPAATIARVAREAGATVIAMATHGCRGPWRFVLGSVTEETLKLAPVPVLVFHAPATPRGPRRGSARAHRRGAGIDRPSEATMMKLLFATDGSAEARAAGELAAALPLVPPVEVVVLHAMEPLWLASDDAQQTARDSAEEILELGTALFKTSPAVTRVRDRLIEAFPIPGILKVAEEEGADLLVIGTRGLSALEGFLEGSPVEPVVERAPCPVLVGPKAGYEAAAPARVLLVVDEALAADPLAARLSDLPLPPWAEVHLLAVAGSDSGSRATAAAVEAEGRRRTDALEGLGRVLEARGHAGSRKVAHGAPAAEIVAAARALKPALLVLGAPPAGRHPAGQIPRLVIRHASCPVLVHRPRRSGRSNHHGQARVLVR